MNFNNMFSALRDSQYNDFDSDYGSDNSFEDYDNNIESDCQPISDTNNLSNCSTMDNEYENNNPLSTCVSDDDTANSLSSCGSDDGFTRRNYTPIKHNNQLNIKTYYEKYDDVFVYNNRENNYNNNIYGIQNILDFINIKDLKPKIIGIEKTNDIDKQFYTIKQKYFNLLNGKSNRDIIYIVVLTNIIYGLINAIIDKNRYTPKIDNYKIIKHTSSFKNIMLYVETLYYFSITDAFNTFKLTSDDTIYRLYDSNNSLYEEFMEKISMIIENKIIADIDNTLDHTIKNNILMKYERSIAKHIAGHGKNYRVFCIVEYIDNKNQFLNEFKFDDTKNKHIYIIKLLENLYTSILGYSIETAIYSKNTLFSKKPLFETYIPKINTILKVNNRMYSKYEFETKFGKKIMEVLFESIKKVNNRSNNTNILIDICVSKLIDIMYT